MVENVCFAAALKQCFIHPTKLRHQEKPVLPMRRWRRKILEFLTKFEEDPVVPNQV